MPVRLTTTDFDRLVQLAVNSLPAAFREFLENVVIEVHDRPQPWVLQDLEMTDPTELMGFYSGIPLTERSVEDTAAMPEYIYIYKKNIEDLCETPDEVLEEVRITVLHEIGHHMGMDEDELDRLGYG